MAMLGVFDPPECPNSSNSEATAALEEKTGQEAVNWANESSAQAPIIAHPGHSGGDHSNSRTHGNSEGANCQKDTLVFSFRNYILGMDDGAGRALGESKEGGQNSGVSQREHPEKNSMEDTEIIAQRNTCNPMQSEAVSNIDYVKKTSTEPVLTAQGEDEKHVDSKAVVKQKIAGSFDYKKASGKKDSKEAMLEGSDINNKIQRDIHLEEDLDFKMAVIVQEMDKKADRAIEIVAQSSPLPCLQDTCETAVIESETHKQADLQTGEEQGINKDVDSQCLSHEREKKKKEKKGQRKKKRTEKRAAIAKESVSKPQSNTDTTESTLSVTPAGLNIEHSIDCLVNAESPLQVVSHVVMCVEQPDNGLNYKEQLSPMEMASFSPPLAAPDSGLSGLLLCSPPHNLTHSEGTQQSDHHNHTDGPPGPTNSADDTLSSGQHLTGSIKTDQNTPIQIEDWNSFNMNITLCTADDKTSTVESQKDVCTSKEEIHTNSPLTQHPALTSVGDGGRERALLDASAIATVLPLTTPTVAEFIEGEREGESERSDSAVSVATVAFTVSEAAGGDGGLGIIEISAVGERENSLLDSLPPLSLIGSKEKCSLAFSFRETQAEEAEEGSCGSNTTSNNPVDTESNEAKDLLDADVELMTILSSTESEAEKEPLGTEACINTSLQEHSVVERERVGERAGGAGGAGGGGGEVAERGGIVREHRSPSQPECSAGGVSSAETEKSPPPEAAESQVESHRCGEPVAAIIESPSATQHSLPEPPRARTGARAEGTVVLCNSSQRCSDNTEANSQDGFKPNTVEKALASGPSHEDTLITQTAIDHNGNGQCSAFLPLNAVQYSRSEVTESQQIQTVNSASDTVITTTTTISCVAEPCELAHSQGTAGGAMSGAAGVSIRDNSGGHRRVHFNDTVKKGDSCSVLRSTVPLDLGCASLPPLTVHESLHYPVVETSYSFIKEILQKSSKETAPKSNESAKQTLTDRLEPTNRDVKSDRVNFQINTVEEKQGKGQLPKKDKADTKEACVESGRQEVCFNNNGQLPSRILEMKQGSSEDVPDPSNTTDCTQSNLDILSSSITQSTPSLEVPDCFPEALSIKDDSAINTTDDPREPKIDVEIEEKNENLRKGQSVDKYICCAKSTADTQSVDEVCVNTDIDKMPVPCAVEKKRVNYEECIDISRSAVSGTAALTEKKKSAASESGDVNTEQEKLTKSSELDEEGIATACVSLVTEMEKLQINGLVSANKDPESPLVHDTNVTTVIVEEEVDGQSSICSSAKLSADNLACKPLSDVSMLSPVGQISTDQHSISNRETVTLTNTASINLELNDFNNDTSHPLDLSTASGLEPTDTPKGVKDGSVIETTALSTGESSVTLEVTTNGQCLPISKQFASKPTLVLKPPGPMLSHLEIINDISLPDQPEIQSTENGNSKISENVIDTNDMVNDTKDALKCIYEHANPASVVLDNSPDFLIISPNREMDKQKQPSHSPPTIGQLGEFDNAIAQANVGPESGMWPIIIEPISCDASIIDGLINVSQALSSSSALTQDNMKGRNRDNNSPFDEDETKPDEKPMHKQKETKVYSQKGTADSSTQQDNRSDKEAGEDIRNLPAMQLKVKDTELPSKESKDVISGIEMDDSQLVLGLDLQQFPTATTDPCSDGDAAVDRSDVRNLSQSKQAVNNFAQQQETQGLGSSHTSEQSSVCLLEQSEGEEKSSSEISKPPLIEEVQNSAGTLCESAGSDVLTADDHCVTGRVKGLEIIKNEEEAGEGAQGVNIANIANDMNKSGLAVEREAIANTEIATVRSHESEKTPEASKHESTPSEPAKSSLDLMSKDEFGRNTGSEGQGTTVLPPCRQDQDGNPESTENTVAPVGKSPPNLTVPLETPLLLQVSVNGSIFTRCRRKNSQAIFVPEKQTF